MRETPAARRWLIRTPGTWTAAFVLFTLSLAGALHAQTSVRWTPCSEDDVGSAEECAQIELPLDHGQSGGPTMTIAARRVLGASPGGRQLWYLAGGPGDAVGGALGRLATLIDDAELDLYALDHRGTGGSGLLACPDQQAPESMQGTEISAEEWPDCIEHIRGTRDDLEFLTVSQSARDLGAVIEMLRPDGAEVYVLGASYGTFWANRYLQLFPDQPTGVILDGLVPADWSFAEFDATLDATARRWLAACITEPECETRLGPDPAGFVLALHGRIAGGHCDVLGLDQTTSRLILGAVLMVDALPNALIPALAYRLDRCAWHDQMAVLQLFRGVFDGLAEAPTHSPALQRHVALSELWNADDPTPDALASALEHTVATTDVSASFARTRADWPLYAPDPLDGRQAAYAGPLLMIHGGLDPTMPLERLDAFRTSYVGPHQTFVAIPEAGHVVVNYSDCARRLYRAFLSNPRSELDTTCVGTQRFVDLDPESDRIADLLGASLWGDDVPLATTVGFKLRYRWLPLVIGLLVPLWVGLRARGPSRRPARAIIAVLLWAGIVLGTYVVVVSTPLVVDYRSAPATTVVLAAVLVQALLGLALARWSGGPAAR